jgi:hypothetical protein
MSGDVGCASIRRRHQVHYDGSVATKRTKNTILHLAALGLAAVVLNPRLWMIAFIV